MNFSSAPDRHRWLSNNSMMVAAKLATSFKTNWKIAKLGDLAEKIQTGTTPPSQERRYYDGDTNWFTPADIGGNRWLSIAKKSITDEAVNEKKARIFDVGTILITCIGHIGRVGILSETSSANQQITGIKFNKIIDPEFAYYGLFAKQDELQAAAPTASTLSILNQDRLSNIDFCFPSLKEQIQISKFLSWYEDRLINGQPFENNYPALPNYLSDLPSIVERVENLADRIAKAQSLREDIDIETEAFLASIRHRACTGELGVDWRIHNKNILPTAKLLEQIASQTWDGHAPSRKRSPMSIPQPPQIPETWLTITFGELQEIGAILDIQDGNHGGDYPRQNEFSETGIPFVTAKQMAEASVDILGAPRLPQERAQRLRIGFAKGGDVLISHNASVGKVVRAPVDAGDFLLGTSATYYRCNPHAIDPNYLVHFMKSDLFQSQLQWIMKQTTRNQVSVLKQVNLWICLPPLEEQHYIAEYLDSVQARLASLRELQSQTGEELDALLPSVLDRAFKGEL